MHMNEKQKKSEYRSISPQAIVPVLIIIIMLLIIGYVQTALLVPAAVLLIAAYFAGHINRRHEEGALLSRYFESIEGEMDESIAASVLFNPFPLCMIDNSGVIVWCNRKFQRMFPEDDNPLDQEIDDITGIKLHEMKNSDLKERVITIMSINRSFRVQTSDLDRPFEPSEGDQPGENENRVRMFHWMDVSELEELKRTYQNEKTCVLHLRVDNLDDILEEAPDDRKASLAGEIEKLIRQWAVKSRAAVIRISKSRYVVVCDRRALENIEANKFRLLDEVRALDTGGDIPASLSIGAGAAGKSIAQNDEFSLAALDLALGRGGDQAVVRKDEHIEYYGGKLQTAGKRNKGHSRIVAIALRRFIEQAQNNIFVMGHTLPDMDALGAAVGITRFARLLDHEVHIVIDSWDAVDIPYRLLAETGNYQFITSEKARAMARPDDLLIVVDTHRPQMTECPELIEIVRRVVVIDHHRRSPDAIRKPVLTHIEPYASSACELVTEMLQYVITVKKGITDLEAEVLLAGLVLDTKNFSVKCGVRTFEAASWLRRQGADPAIVRKFFQIDMDVVRKKAEIISNAHRMEHGVALSRCEKPQKNISVLISMAANDLLNVRGICASFVLGTDENGNIRVSSRSLGAVNVQRIMEKVGGGGNLTMAGAQLEMSMDEAVDLMTRTINEYMEEEGDAVMAEPQKPTARQFMDTIRIPHLDSEKK